MNLLFDSYIQQTNVLKTVEIVLQKLCNSLAEFQKQWGNGELDTIYADILQ